MTAGTRSMLVKSTAGTGLIALAAAVLSGCAQFNLGFGRATESAAERGAEERPPTRIAATLPPEAAAVTPSAPGAQSEPSDEGLSANGPWILYCAVDGRGSLMDLDGLGRQVSPLPCPTSGSVSGAAGLGLELNNLFQFPALQAVRWAPGEASTWSADGSTALMTNTTADGATELLVYDVAADRFRSLTQTDFAFTPLGLSPDGTWAVYLDFDPSPRVDPRRDPPGQVVAISTGRREARTFYSEYGLVPSAVLGWLSDSSFLIQRQDAACEELPNQLELLWADMDGGAQHLFDRHSYAALDPESQTVMLNELPRGACPNPDRRWRVMRLSAADGWEPRPVPAPEGWLDEWEVGRIEWHPELGLFSVRISETELGPQTRMITVTPDGSVVHEFSGLGGGTDVGTNLFPSPDGLWIVMGPEMSGGVGLYNAAGQLVRQLVVEGGELSQGAAHVVWLPGQAAFLISPMAGQGIFRAAAEDGWQPQLIEPEARPGTELILAGPPERTFTAICGGRNYTRLQVGDRVMVSFEPPLASRLREDAGLSAEVSGMLEPGQQADIQGGPACADGYVWWLLEPQDLGLRGWTAEGDAEGAWLVPLGTSISRAPPAAATPVAAGPTPTPLPLRALSPTGPWLVGAVENPGGLEEVRALNADGSGLTRLPGYWFPHAAADLRDGVSDQHSLVALRSLDCAITECYYNLRLFRLPQLDQVRAIRLIYPDLAWDLGHGDRADALAAHPPLMAVGWEGEEPAMLWSPDGRYLAFVAAIDGPSADVYAYDRQTTTVLRLTDGPGQPVLIGWSPDSRWIVHMEVTFEYGDSGPAYEPVAVWAADVTTGPARYLYASRGGLGDSERIVGWRSGGGLVTVERNELGDLGRLARVDIVNGGFETLYAGAVASAAVDPASGTLAFVPYDPGFFPLRADPGRRVAAEWADAAGVLAEGGIYLLHEGSELAERLDFEEWYTAYDELRWIPEIDRFFGAWSQAASFTADGLIGRVFTERYVPAASPDGNWLVFQRPPHFPGIAIYTPDGDQAYEFEGIAVTDVLWKRDSSGVYLYSPELGLRLFSPSLNTYLPLHEDPGFSGGSLRLVYP